MTCALNKKYCLPNLVIYLLLFLPAVFAAQAQMAVPPHGGRWVHDKANALSPQTRAHLEAMLQAGRDSTSNQMAILILPSIENDDIDLLANRVFNEWKLGDEKKDNGVLLLIALNDRKMRIEVGQGLEGVLTDALSSRIIRNEVAPAFRQGNYDAGVIAGTLAIIKAIEGEYKADDQNARQSFPWLPFILILLFILISSRGRRGGGGSAGYWTTAMLLSSMGGGGRGSSWGGGSFGGGGFSGGGGSSGSW
jgi:uncharacterized protein